MTDDRLAKVKERDRAMRKARDEILSRVGAWLRERSFERVGAGHFTQLKNGLVCHIGFQKHTSGRNVRVMCHFDGGGFNPVMGPRSDAYECRNSPNGIQYSFGWSTREEDMASCADQYCRYIDDVIIPWFHHSVPIQ